ncbi:MAG: hypothetical protein K8R52_10180 [Bacteroidales bacterium]|nr:hypothetical protein [Bacteroidales bacterium]
MKKRILFLLFCLLQSAIILSQETGTSRTIGNLNLDDGLTFDNRYDGVKGTPFIFKDYQRAILFAPNTPPIEVDYLNFDRYSRELCYKSSATENALQLNKYLVDSFYVFNPKDTLRFLRLPLESSSDYVFMECLYGGKDKLYLDHGKSFNSSDYVNPYSSDRRYDEFKEMPAFYLQFEQKGDLFKVKKNKKQFASLFGPYSEQISAYIKTQKTSLKSRADLISLMQFYDRIKTD